jgi:hypothetical protein
MVEALTAQPPLLLLPPLLDVVPASGAWSGISRSGVAPAAA